MKKCFIDQWPFQIFIKWVVTNPYSDLDWCWVMASGSKIFLLDMFYHLCPSGVNVRVWLCDLRGGYEQLSFFLFFFLNKLRYHLYSKEKKSISPDGFIKLEYSWVCRKSSAIYNFTQTLMKDKETSFNFSAFIHIKLRIQRQHFANISNQYLQQRSLDLTLFWNYINYEIRNKQTTDAFSNLSEL